MLSDVCTLRLYNVSNADGMVSFGTRRDANIRFENVTREVFCIRLRTFAKGDFALVSYHGNPDAYADDNLMQKDIRYKILKGDSIRILNITIIWLGRYVAVSGCDFSVVTSFYEVDIRQLQKKTYIEEPPVFCPAPRRKDVIDETEIELDSPPARRAPDKMPVLISVGPALTMVIPIMLGCSRSTAVYTSLLAALWAFINVMTRRKKARNAERRRRNAYRKYVKDCEENLKNRNRKNRNVLLASSPAISDYVKFGANPYLMWNRQPKDVDYRKYRIGLGDITDRTSIKIPKEKYAETDDSLRQLPAILKEKYEVLSEVPILVDIGSGCVQSIVCDAWEHITMITLSLIMQIAVSSPPDTTRIAIVGDMLSKYSDDYKKIMVLPHLWYSNECLIGLENRSGKVMKTIERMIAEYKGDEAKLLIVFTDDIEFASGIVNRENVAVVLMSDDYSKLPAYSGSVIQKNAAFTGHYNIDSPMNTRKSIALDSLKPKEAQYYASLVAAASGELSDDSKGIPENVNVFELFEKMVDEDDIIRFWENSDVGDSMRIPIGMRENKTPACLDMHEKQHGPHGLIAGTTGSGKSELLQTIVIMLASMYPPWQVGFLLIDYKGGGMANIFNNLPHVLGSISNLSGALVDRALISIKSENLRRQRIFASVNVNNIRDYHRLYQSDESMQAIPHVFVIIDEFAELKREEPDFMQQLISVAQVGRSLGVHLILATQKPGGVVDDKIWSNSRFRLCLKMQDTQDSNEMLKKTDAAYLKRAGSAYLQVGNDEIYYRFQSAYTMADISQSRMGQTVTLYNDLGEQFESSDSDKLKDNTLTQLDYLKKCICDAWKNKKRPIMPLWTEPLSNDYITDNPVRDNKCIFGRFDDPYMQIQGDCLYDVNDGNTLVIGPAGSGKSTVIQTILLGLVNLYTSDEINVFIVDYGGKLLRSYEKADIVGGYISDDEPERIMKLFIYLQSIVKKRRKEYGGTSFDKEREKGKADPRILVVIDNYAAASEAVERGFDSIVTEILTYSRQCGMNCLIGAGEISAKDFSQRNFELIQHTIALGIGDKYKYSLYMKAKPGEIPVVDIKTGRGVTARADRFVEFESYRTFVADDNLEREKYLYERIELRNKDFEGKSRGFPYVPKNPVCEDLLHRIKEEKLEDTVTTLGLPVGYQSISGELYRIPPGVGRMLIFGKKGSGRHTLMSVIALVASRYNVATYSVTSVRALAAYLENEAAPCKRRVLLLIDELGPLVRKFYDEDFERKAEEEICRRITEQGAYTIITALSPSDRNTCSGLRIYEVITRDAYGICMGGSLDNQNLFDFSYLSYSKQAASKPDGVGTVPMFAKGFYYGDVIVPSLFESEEF